MVAVTEKCTEATAPNSNTVNSEGNKDNIDSNGNANSSEPKSEFKEFNVQKLVDMFRKLNPLAKEFITSSYHNQIKRNHFSVNNFAVVKQPGNENANFNANPRITEERLAGLFSSCREVVDCRVCGDPHSVLHFAFVEFASEEGARTALNLGRTMLGFYPVKVLPSKTAILPVNPTILLRSDDEREMCTRTVYCTNIDKKVTRLRLLGDHVHSTRIAFVEFAMAESVITALNCGGMVLGTQLVRVSPSKTPVRPRVAQPTVY